MIYLSYSSITDFLDCSKRYYYRTAFSEKSIATQDMAVGSIVHKVIEQSLTRSKDESFVELIRLCDEYSVDGTGRSKAMGCLTNYFDLSISSLLKEHDLVEYVFEEKILPDVTIRGKIDRIIIDEGILVDWKTGDVRKKSISSDIQFIIYNRVYKSIFKKEPKASFLVALQKGELIPYIPNREYSEALFQEVIPSIVSRIKARDFTREGYFTSKCFRCSFLNICGKE